MVTLPPSSTRIDTLFPYTTFFDLPVAAYIVALMFGLAHWKSFTVDPFYQAMAQQIYAFVWGLIYVWLMERSRSLFAPMVAHGMGNFTEVAIVIALRSEEHTFELQSLMRISYAVFCLKKKTEQS